LLQDVNLTTEQYIAKLALRTAIADWVRRTFVDPQEATAQEVAASYETRQKELTIPVSIWLERIVVNAAGDQEARGKAHTAAVAARARVAAGQSFAAVVPSVTEGSAPPPAAGAFSQARVQESQLPPPVLSALHSLEAGEISPVLELPNAFVLLRWRDRHASRQPSLNQVAAGLELNLKENKGHERFAAYLEALKQEAGLVFYLPLDPPTSRSEPPASQGSLLLP
jgi:parvulin-like peptidyl-prolyl isomerase